MDQYELVCNKIPSVNHLYGRTKFGGTYVTKKGKEFKESARLQIINQMEKHGTVMLGKPVRVDITLFYTERLRRDVDNSAKILLDCMTGLIYNDDSQIYELTMRKLLAQSECKVVIRVEEIENVTQWIQDKVRVLICE